jgi:hypothetical protein
MYLESVTTTLGNEEFPWGLTPGKFEAPGG